MLNLDDKVPGTDACNVNEVHCTLVHMEDNYPYGKVCCNSVHMGDFFHKADGMKLRSHDKGCFSLYAPCSGIPLRPIRSIKDDHHNGKYHDRHDHIHEALGMANHRVAVVCHKLPVDLYKRSHKRKSEARASEPGMAGICPRDKIPDTHGFHMRGAYCKPPDTSVHHGGVGHTLDNRPHRMYDYRTFFWCGRP